MSSISVSAADVQARLSTDAYARLADPNGVGSVDSTWVNTHLQDAIAEAEARLRAAFGDELPSSLASSALVKQLVVSLWCANAALCFPGGAAGASPQAPAPYEAHRKRAEALFKQIAEDKSLRPTLTADRPRPRASLGNDLTSDGIPTNPFSRAADLKDPSGF